MRTTAGQLLVNDALPEEYRDYSRAMGKADTDELLRRIAIERPEEYGAISGALMRLGANASFDEGTTLRLSDTLGVIDKEPLLEALDAQEKLIDKSNMSESDKKHARADLYVSVADAMSKATLEAATASGNPFALQVKSKARGNPGQLAALLTSPGIYQDAKDDVVPVFIRRSYAEGLKPHEYFAATYGARKGVLSSKYATRDAGYLGKLIGLAVMDQVVSEDDCGTPYGVPVSTKDKDNYGTLLARDTGPFKAGTAVTKDIADALAAKKIDRIVVRSPLTCGTQSGLCRHCVGRREGDKLPDIGSHIGAISKSALAEPLAQGSLNIKHSGRKEKGKQVFSGFNLIRSLVTVPAHFQFKATVSEKDGEVSAVTEAPQGGWFVNVGDEKHYVPHELGVSVKEGDTVEAGDSLSYGVPSPADVVRHKGVGEGRRHFAEQLTQAMRDSNYGASRRNAEILSRALINHVKVEDKDAGGSYLPGEITRYGSWAYGYKPRKDANRLIPKAAIGRYLEEPAMHYTIGTRITKRVAEDLNKYGSGDILAHTNPVGVDPLMLSVVRTPEFSGDWMARLGTSYVKSRLLEDAQTGATSNVHGIHPIPGIAKGTEFGESKTVPYTF